MWKNVIKNEIEKNTYLFDKIEDDYIKKRLRVCFEWYVEKAIKNKYYFYVLSSITIIAPIVSEVLLLCPIDTCCVKLIAGIFIGFSTAATAFLSLLGAQDKWRIYRDQAEMIKSSLSLCGGVVNEERLQEFEKDMGQTHGLWKKISKNEDDE